jgi:lipopolysaccharide/colanic/teichoic acid biosynthesis glycosyltransferase
MIVQRQPQHSRMRVSDQQDRAVYPHVIKEELFRAILIMERKRSDRFHQRLALLLVTVNNRPGAVSSTIWEAVIEALSAAKRETDVLGWFESGTVIGIVLPQFRAPDVIHACDFEARVRRELAKRLDTETASRLAIRLHVHTNPTREREQKPWSADPSLFQELRSSHGRRMLYDPIKRGLDIIGSATLLVLLLPLFLLIAALVKVTSRGPAFFGQRRIGHMMKPFTMLKFRTMRLNADHGIHVEFMNRFIKSGGQAQERGGEAVFKLVCDPRVTLVGRVLRKTSFDELPQLWNVLRGEMSLVGPRPPLPYELEQYKSWHCRRVLDAKPGITGLWQVAGRSRTTFDEMVRLDLRYARSRSIWEDVKILLATPAAVISGRGAY